MGTLIGKLVSGNGGVAMTNAPEGVAVLEAAQQHLHAVTGCIDYLSQVNASAALRTLAVRLQELSFRAGRVRQTEALVNNMLGERRSEPCSAQ
jgi:hypothetical protein